MEKVKDYLPQTNRQAKYPEFHCWYKKWTMTHTCHPFIYIRPKNSVSSDMFKNISVGGSEKY